jgi:hypothetical protein
MQVTQFLDQNRFCHGPLVERKVGVGPKRVHVALSPRGKIVHADNPVAKRQQSFGQVTPDKSGNSRQQTTNFHGKGPLLENAVPLALTLK